MFSAGDRASVLTPEEARSTNSRTNRKLGRAKPQALQMALFRSQGKPLYSQNGVCFGDQGALPNGFPPHNIQRSAKIPSIRNVFT